LSLVEWVLRSQVSLSRVLDRAVLLAGIVSTAAPDLRRQAGRNLTGAVEAPLAPRSRYVGSTRSCRLQRAKASRKQPEASEGRIGRSSRDTSIDPSQIHGVLDAGGSSCKAGVQGVKAYHRAPFNATSLDSARDAAHGPRRLLPGAPVAAAISMPRSRANRIWMTCTCGAALVRVVAFG